MGMKILSSSSHPNAITNQYGFFLLLQNTKASSPFPCNYSEGSIQALKKDGKAPCIIQVAHMTTGLFAYSSETTR